MASHWTNESIRNVGEVIMTSKQPELPSQWSSGQSVLRRMVKNGVDRGCISWIISSNASISTIGND